MPQLWSASHVLGKLTNQRGQLLGGQLNDDIGPRHGRAWLRHRRCLPLRVFLPLDAGER